MQNYQNTHAKEESISALSRTYSVSRASIMAIARDDGVGRTIRIARLIAGTESNETMSEPRIVWMSKEGFALAGFERVSG